MTTKENYKKSSGQLRLLLSNVVGNDTLDQNKSYTCGQFICLTINRRRKLIWNTRPDNLIANIVEVKSFKDGQYKTIIQYRHNSDYRDVLANWKYRQANCYSHSTMALARQRRLATHGLRADRVEVVYQYEQE